MRDMTLRAIFQRWVERFVRRTGKDVDVLLERLGYVRSGRTFTRDEMNAR